MARKTVVPSVDESVECGRKHVSRFLTIKLSQIWPSSDERDRCKIEEASDLRGCRIGENLTVIPVNLPD